MINFKKIFKLKYFFIFLTLFFCIFFFIMYFNSYVKKHFENNVLETIQNLSFENSLNINNEIKNKFKTLNNLANNLTETDISNAKETVKKLYSFIRPNNFKNFTIATPDGIAYANTGETIDISDMEYFKESINGKNFISNSLSSKIDSKKTNIFSIPLFENNKVIGVLTASILTEDFYKDISLQSINELGFTFIIDEIGNLIAYENAINFPFEDLNLFNAKMENSTNNVATLNGYFELNYNNEFYYMYYTKLNYSDWWLITSIPYNTIKNSYSNIVETTRIISIIILTLLVILFSIILSKENKSYSRLKSIAYIDSITDGKNDLFLKENINKFIKKESNYAFCSIEIINIKNMINMLGIKKSNFILKEIYTYLNSILSYDEIVVHSYLGEYKLLLKYDNIKNFTQRIDTISFSSIDENIIFKIGVYLIDKSNIDFENMCSYVSIAKEAIINNNKYFIYNKKLHQRELYKINLEQDIKNGIENKEFKSWFQPKYGKDGKTIIGAEALVRWYKYGSIISPCVFVPMCERTGLIKEIDILLFEDVCKNIRNWINKNKKVVPISINLSRAYLDKSNFIDILEEYIKKYKIPRSLIELEITESSLIENEEKLKSNISLLRKKGFKILLDDFGVGYSSIKTISDIEFDTLKIDRSFIKEIGSKKWENIIVYTVNLAHNLGMDVVTEGIETKEQYLFLLSCNCNMFQGYYFNRPMSPKDFSKLI